LEGIYLIAGTSAFIFRDESKSAGLKLIHLISFLSLKTVGGRNKRYDE
jgi:hypothetical protein